MIPAGDETHIMRVLRYMPPAKVLQWAQVTISPAINERDIARLARRASRSERSIGGSKCTDHPFNWQDTRLTDPGTLGRSIDAFIAAKPDPARYRSALGWR